MSRYSKTVHPLHSFPRQHMVRQASEHGTESNQPDRKDKYRATVTAVAKGIFQQLHWGSRSNGNSRGRQLDFGLGGIILSEIVYVELRRFLDGLPSGFPTTPDGVELKILKKLFTPEEAEIAKRCGMTEGEAEEMLASMARKGSQQSTNMMSYVYYCHTIYTGHIC